MFKTSRLDYYSLRAKAHISKVLVPLGVCLTNDVARDRVLFEEKILPHFAADPDTRDILFVGCDWFTAKYKRTFSHKNFISIDNKPGQARWGAGTHIVGSMTDLDKFFAPETLDLILCNGVIGWGLDQLAHAETAVSAAHKALRPGGVFLLGTNDIPRRRPFPLEDLQALDLFQPFTFPPLDAQRYLANENTRHIFAFFRK